MKNKVDGVITNEGVTEKVTHKKEDYDEYEYSAMMFRGLYEKFKTMGYKLAERKKKAPIRVLEAFIFQPFEEVELVGQEEKNLLDICRQVMYHKMKVNEYALLKQEELNKEENEDV